MKSLKETALITFFVTVLPFSLMAHDPSEGVCKDCDSSTSLATAGMILCSIAGAMRVIRIAPGLAVENGVGTPAMATLSLIFIVASGAVGGVTGYLIAVSVDYLKQCIFFEN